MDFDELDELDPVPLGDAPRELALVVLGATGGRGETGRAGDWGGWFGFPAKNPRKTMENHGFLQVFATFG